MKKRNSFKRPLMVVLLILVMLGFIIGPSMKKDNASKKIANNLNHQNDQKKKEKEIKYTFKKEGVLKFIKSEKPPVLIDIEVADNFKERMLGLMYRRTMLDNQGMLFIFDQEGPQSFWMKNTYISLDIMYVNDQYEIVDLYTNTTPQSNISLPSRSPAKYVVETVAGFANYHNIKIGDKLEWQLD